jgi:hypothetical protein
MVVALMDKNHFKTVFDFTIALIGVTLFSTTFLLVIKGCLTPTKDNFVLTRAKKNEMRSPFYYGLATC